MNVSKISILNVNNPGVSPFRGDTSGYNNKSDLSKTSGATKFLYGAGVLSAGLIALGLAGRAGLFSKTVKKASTEASDVISSNLQVSAKEEIIKSIPVKFAEQTVPVNGSRAERLKANAPDMAKAGRNMDYPDFTDKNTTEMQKTNFWEMAPSRISGMSYEDQHDEIGYFFDFVKTIPPSEVKIPASFALNLKRDNSDYFWTKTFNFLTENPQYQERFKGLLFGLGNNLFDCKKQGETYAKIMKPMIFPASNGNEYVPRGMQAVFFTNTDTKISQMPYEKQVEAFKEYLDFIKTLEPEQIKYSIIFTPGRYNGDNNVKIAEEAIKFAKENPDYNDTIVSNLVAYKSNDGFINELLSHHLNFKYDNISGCESEKARFCAGIDRHLDIIIQIRKMLSGSGLRCDENTRLKNRQDWLVTGSSPINRYAGMFRMGNRMPELRAVAFEYDMKQGLSAKEADELIKTLTEREKTYDRNLLKQETGMTLGELTAKINAAVK